MALTGADRPGGLVTAERVRAAVAEMKVDDAAGKSLSATVSVGVACYERGDTVDGLIDRADRAMYVAKSSGRNQVVAAWMTARRLESVGGEEGPAKVSVG